MFILLVAMIDLPDDVLLEVRGPLLERLIDSALLLDIPPFLLDALLPEVEAADRVLVLLAHGGVDLGGL